jgi:CheY-like chemotaxis protein
MQLLKALIIDDVPSNLLIIGKHLQNLGLSFEKAASGLEALNKIKSQTFDFVLMDIYMPEMSGFETTEAIRNLDDLYYKTVPIIGISAETGEGIIEKSSQAGMNDFLPKPFTTADLSRVISKNLDARILDSVKIVAVHGDLKKDIEFAKSLLELTLKEFNDFRKNFGLEAGNKNIERIQFYKNNLKLPMAQYNMSKIVRYIDEFLAFLEKDGIDEELENAIEAFDIELDAFCKELESLL